MDTPPCWEELASRIDSQGTRIDSLGTRIDAMDHRIDAVGARIGALDQKIDRFREDRAPPPKELWIPARVA